jgi:hypothetical protein
VGVHAVVIDRDGHQVRAIGDPAGGTFDSAGDFDRLLEHVPTLVVWSAIDPYGTTTFDSAQASALLHELPAVAELAHGGPERRGLDRLALLASVCAADDGMTLRFIGD